MSLRFGVVPLGRPTFDVPFAERNLEDAFKAIEAAGIETRGPRHLLYDAQAAREAMAEIAEDSSLDAILIIQVTFTDATMTVEIASHATVPVAIWAIPEPRIGGRLRLNAFCGLNLAAHALGKANLSHHSLYALPNAENLASALAGFVSPTAIPQSTAAPVSGVDSTQAKNVLGALRGASISVIGKHPDGFDTCAYDSKALSALCDIKVQQYSLDQLFDRAKSISAPRVNDVHTSCAEQLEGLDQVDQEQLDRSLRLFCALDDIQSESGAGGLAVRCWPETFTDYGCAACGPMAMMNEKSIPSACEADVYGSFSAMLLQEIAQEPAWMADLVDLDFEDDTGVFWHCGLAPLSMCDEESTPEATIHTNRKMPLLHQFPLKAGTFTIARLSQARNTQKLVIGIAEFTKAPMAFTGTSGVMRFPAGTRQVFDTILTEGLEHHYAIAYGDHRGTLRAIAGALALPIVELS